MTNEHDKTNEMPPVNEARRKLTRAGLAIPAVLGTLASKPVLANVPWKCTISGQVSGNVSGHEQETCTSQGQGRATLQTNYQGTVTKLTDLFPGLALYFFWDNGVLSSDNTKPEAKIKKILNTSLATPNNDTNLAYARKAVVLLLNAKSIQDTSIYPLTDSQAIKLYVAAATGGTFNDTNPTVNWSNTQVRYYIDLLYH